MSANNQLPSAVRPLTFKVEFAGRTLRLCAPFAGALRRLLRRVVLALHSGGGTALDVGWLSAGVAFVRVVSPNRANVAACPLVVPSRLLTWTLSAAMPHSLRSRLSGAVCNDFRALRSTVSPTLPKLTACAESTNVAVTEGL